MTRRDNPSKRRQRPRRPAREPEAIPVDVADDADEFVVTASLPGIRKQDIDLRVRKNRVQILADPEGEAGDERVEGPFARRARKRGPISRTIRLPRWVNEDRTSAEYADGGLRVTLPKRKRRHAVEVE